MPRIHRLFVMADRERGRPVPETDTTVRAEDWDGRDLNGALVPQGTYFYKVTSDASSASGRFVIVR